MLYSDDFVAVDISEMPAKVNELQQLNNVIYKKMGPSH